MSGALLIAVVALLVLATTGNAQAAPRWLVVRSMPGVPYTPVLPVDGDGRAQLAAIKATRAQVLAMLKKIAEKQGLSADALDRMGFTAKWPYAIVDTPAYEPGFVVESRVPQFTGDEWITGGFARTEAAITTQLEAMKSAGVYKMLREAYGIEMETRVRAVEAPVLFLDNPGGLSASTTPQQGEVGALPVALGALPGLLLKLAQATRKKQRTLKWRAS